MRHLALLGLVLTLLGEVECVLAVRFTVEKSVDSSSSIEKVDFVTTQSTGVSEDEARAKLQKISADLTRRALDVCKQNYEDMPLCISRGLQNLGATYDRAGIALKKQLEETVQSQCKNQIGKCKVEEDIKCYERRDTSQAEAGDGASEQNKPAEKK